MLRMFVRPAALTSRIASKRFLGVISKAELIEEAKNPDVVIIDVRDHNEVAGGTIPAASWAHFPLDEFDDMTSLNEKNFELIYEMKKPTKDQKVIFYCMRGMRSKTAGHLWEQMGATNVHHYEGGWKVNLKWGTRKISTTRPQMIGNNGAEELDFHLRNSLFIFLIEMLRRCFKPNWTYNIKRPLGTVNREQVNIDMKNPEVLLIDLRTSNLMKGGRIPAVNWCNIPMNEFEHLVEFDIEDEMFENLFKVKRPHSNQKIIFYDMNGWNSELAAISWERGMDGRNVYYYPGGWFDWNITWYKDEWVSWMVETGYATGTNHSITDEELYKNDKNS